MFAPPDAPGYRSVGIEPPDPFGDWLLPLFDPPDPSGYWLLGLCEPDPLGGWLFAPPFDPPVPGPMGLEVPAGEVLAAGAGQRAWPRSVPAATAAVAVAAATPIRHFRRRGAVDEDEGGVDQPAGDDQPAVGGGVPPEGCDTDDPGGRPPGAGTDLGVAGGDGLVTSKPVFAVSVLAGCSCAWWSGMADTSLRVFGTCRGCCCRVWGVTWPRGLRWVTCEPLAGQGGGRRWRR
jgi:hypothetical protein